MREKPSEHAHVDNVLINVDKLNYHIYSHNLIRLIIIIIFVQIYLHIDVNKGSCCVDRADQHNLNKDLK
jgi:hypothetical protein